MAVKRIVANVAAERIDAAKAFYQHWDFTELPGHPYRLFLGAKQLDALMGEPAG